MKKFLLLFALTAALCACGDDNENPQPTPSADNFTFVGSLEVTPEAESRFEAFSEQNIEMSLQTAADGTLTLVMPEIKFVPQMPWLAIEVRSLQKQIEGNDLYFSVEQTIPYFMGAPYDNYPITNLEGRYTASTATLQVEFDCNTMHVKYMGN